MRWVTLQMHRMTLLQRLVILGAVLFLGVFVLVVYLAAEAARSFEERIVQDRLRAAEMTARNLNTMISHGVDELRQVALVTQSSGLDGKASPSDYLLQALTVELDTLFTEGVVLLDLDGSVLADQPEGAFQGGGKALVSLLSARGGLLGPGPIFTPVYWDPSAGAARLAVAVPVLDGNGAPRAVLVGIMNPSKTVLAGELRAGVVFAATGHADLLDHAGFLMTSTEEDAIPLSRGDHPAFYERMREALAPDIQSVAHGVDPAYPVGENHVMAYVPLSSVPWAVSLGSGESWTFAPVRQFQERVYWLAGIVLALAMVGGLLGAARLVEPVRVLSGAARRMAGGDLASPIAIREGGEISELAESMEKMRVRLKTSLEHINEINQDLERRIAARTAELEHRGRELEAASSIAERVTSFMHLQEVLDHVLESVAEATHQESIAIFMADRQRQRMTLVASRGLPAAFMVSETSVGMGECLCGFVAATGRQVIAQDLMTSPRITRSLCLVCGFRSVAAYPLLSREGGEGVLAIFARQPNSLDARDLGVVDLLCRQLGVAIHNSRLYTEVEEKEKIVRQLFEKAINAQEEERKRLARDLHDETGQALTAIVLSLESVERGLPAELEAPRGQILALQEMTRQALSGLRRMILALRPSALDDLGLVVAVRRYAWQQLEAVGISAEIKADNLDPIEPPVQTLLFRIAQEAVNNVARHSRATHATLRFSQEEGRVCVVVEDDGIGFSPNAHAKASSSSSGLGILGMHERASLVGGEVTVTSEPGKGTRVLISVPNKVGGPHE